MITPPPKKTKKLFEHIPLNLPCRCLDEINILSLSDNHLTAVSFSNLYSLEVEGTPRPPLPAPKFHPTDI